MGCVEQDDRATAVTLFRNVLTSVPCHLVPIEGQTQAVPPAPPSSWALPWPPLFSCLKCRGLGNTVKGAHSSGRHSRSLGILL